MIRPCTNYVTNMHEVYFDRHSRYVSTVLEEGFDQAPDVFQPCLRYLSAVARGMFRPSREVCFDHARVMFFDHS